MQCTCSHEYDFVSITIKSADSTIKQEEIEVGSGRGPLLISSLVWAEYTLMEKCLGSIHFAL